VTTILDQLATHDHEQVIAFQNRAAGLRGFLAIHDTTLGPALGGVRLWRYAREDDALADALRLSRAMTYKGSLAELPCGGGKTVILDHPRLDRAAAFEAFGRLVASLHGRYFTGRDLGITDDDLATIGRFTRYVAREVPPEPTDVSESTAMGVWHGMRACLEFAGIAARGARVAVQGVGSVGRHLCQILHREGMELIVADVDSAHAEHAAAEFAAHVVAPDEILSAPCEVFAPCALGGVLNRDSIPRLAARIVCGSANNVLAEPDDADALARRRVLYAPDYLVNAGGLIRGAEYYLLGRTDCSASLARIYERTHRVLALALEHGLSTARVADSLAESRLQPNKRFADLTWSKNQK
jgi:leucine dehydrogenase